jgi:hypothetical protein
MQPPIAELLQKAHISPFTLPALLQEGKLKLSFTMHQKCNQILKTQAYSTES